MVSSKSNVGCEAGCGLRLRCCGRIIRSFSDRRCIGNDVSPVFGRCLCSFAVLFFVAGVAFDEVGGVKYFLVPRTTGLISRDYWIFL